MMPGELDQNRFTCMSRQDSRAGFHSFILRLGGSGCSSHGNSWPLFQQPWREGWAGAEGWAVVRAGRLSQEGSTVPHRRA